MPAPIRLVGPSPHATLKAYHPPRTPEPRRDATRGSSVGIALLLCALSLGVLAGVALTDYWREITTAALMFLVSAACGLGIAKIDRGQW